MRADRIGSSLSCVIRVSDHSRPCLRIVSPIVGIARRVKSYSKSPLGKRITNALAGMGHLVARLLGRCPRLPGAKPRPGLKKNERRSIRSYTSLCARIPRGGRGSTRTVRTAEAQSRQSRREQRHRSHSGSAPRTQRRRASDRERGAARCCVPWRKSRRASTPRPARPAYCCLHASDRSRQQELRNPARHRRSPARPPAGHRSV